MNSSTWLYQINQEWWGPQEYRLEIWEGERWAWPVRRKIGAAEPPEAGDVVVFFYAPSGGPDPGFYGWAVITEWFPGEGQDEMDFRPVAPSDHLKMHPWRDDDARAVADRIRGKEKQGTLWRVDNEYLQALREGYQPSRPPHKVSIGRSEKRIACRWTRRTSFLAFDSVGRSNVNGVDMTFTVKHNLALRDRGFRVFGSRCRMCARASGRAGACNRDG